MATNRELYLAVDAENGRRATVDGRSAASYDGRQSPEIRSMRRAFMFALLLLTPFRSAIGAAASPLKGLNAWLPSALPHDVGEIRELGVAVVRVQLPWQLVEPEAGRRDWSAVDRVVETAATNGVEVLFLLRSMSAWGTVRPADPRDPNHGASRPKSMDDWRRLVHDMAARYRGRGVSYELENEVNADYWAGTLDEYLDLLRATYPAVKSADPGARVLGSAMACGVLFDFRTPRARSRFFDKHDEWLSAILSTHAFDAVNVHDYYLPEGPQLNGWTFRSYLDHVARLMEREGARGVPLWVTETGFVSRPTPTQGRLDDGSPQRQAELLRAAYRQAAELGAGAVFWLFLRDHPNLGYFGAMGLAGPKDSPQSTWRTFQSIGSGGGAGRR